MKVIEKSRIRPEGRGSRIRCSTLDILNFFPVPVAFVFERTLDPGALARSLAATLEECPVFAGSLAYEQGKWFLDCNASGVEFEVVERSETLEEALRVLPSADRKQTLPDVAIGFSVPSCLMHVRVSQFKGGGTVLAMTWHHAVGDWQSFMCFMRAWSERAAGSPLERPVIVPDRDRYTDEFCDDRHDSSDMRMVGMGEFAGLSLRLLKSNRRQKAAIFHFTEDEVAAIRADLQRDTDARLSANDALTSHVMTTINAVEPRTTPRQVALAMSFRHRTGVPADAIGNFGGVLLVACEHDVTPARFAERLRTAIDGWSPRYRSLRRFADENGGRLSHFRYTHKDMDILEGTGLSHLNRAGIFELTFGVAAPILFFPFNIFALPWYGIVSEGYGSRGSQLAINMPAPVAERLRQPDMQAKLHRFRSASAVLPPADRLPWLA